MKSLTFLGVVIIYFALILFLWNYYKRRKNEKYEYSYSYLQLYHSNAKKIHPFVCTTEDIWHELTNRDINLYIRPNVTTTLNEPRDVCKAIQKIKNSLLILIIIPSAIDHFHRRKCIRETWANYSEFKKFSKLNKFVDSKNNDCSVMAYNKKKDPKYLGKNITYNANDTEKDNDETERYFKVLFMLGSPKGEYIHSLQSSINDEVDSYGDIIQDDFVDSYQNMTLKHLMMIKWFLSNCEESVRYVFKVDDDVFVNTHVLVTDMRRRAQEFDAKANGQKEYVMLGTVVYGGIIYWPGHKYFVPHYLYRGTGWPHYLLGAGYVLSTSAIASLYAQASETPYMNMDDIYITGLLRLRATPRISLIDDARYGWNTLGNVHKSCSWYNRISNSQSTDWSFRVLHRRTLDVSELERCAKIYRDYENSLKRKQMKEKMMEYNNSIATKWHIRGAYQEKLLQ